VRGFSTALDDFVSLILVFLFFLARSKERETRDDKAVLKPRTPELFYAGDRSRATPAAERAKPCGPAFQRARVRCVAAPGYFFSA
jgi:hypothetical protein